MRKPISRQSFQTPRSGRRIRPITTAKSGNGDDRPNARDLLGTVNAASEGASATWIAFLGSMAYLAVTLGGVTHVDLLLNEPTSLPFVGFKVPLTSFFIMAPLAFVLIHFALLLQHVMLSRKLRAFEERLQTEQPSRDRNNQNIRDELHSYSFTQLVSSKPKTAAVDMALHLVMTLTLMVFPLLLLTFFQIGFLPYHSEPITWWHRGMLLADVTLVVVLSRHLLRRPRETKVGLTDWWHHTSAHKARLTFWWRSILHVPIMAVSRLSMLVRGRDYGPTIASTICLGLKVLRGAGSIAIRAVSPRRIVIGVLLFFSTCVATLPDGALDKVMRSITPLSEPLPYCRPQNPIAPAPIEECPEGASATRHAFYLTAFLFERKVNETTGKSSSWLGWSRNLVVTDKHLVDDRKQAPLNFRGRDLRYATLDRSHLMRSDFYGAKLGGGRLVQTKLDESSFYTATLQGADLSLASLRGAELSVASLQSADLSEANLQGADLSLSQLQSADLSGASLQGVDFSLARLQDADLSMANLQGASLAGASLQAADLFRANLRGADLSEASLQGAVLSHTSLEGANLSQAGLQGASLAGAGLQGADLYKASIWRTGAPGDKGMPLGPAEDLASFAQLDIRPLSDDQKKELSSIISKLEKLRARMIGEGVFGQERSEIAAKELISRIAPLLETKDDDKWQAGEDLKTWCKVARRPPPHPVKLSTYLGMLACEDDTDKAYAAQRLIGRALKLTEPNAFLEAFKSCPAFARLPHDLKSRLERAAEVDRSLKERTWLANIQAKESASLACKDPTGTASMARWNVVRSVRKHPETFLAAFRGCATFPRVAGELRSWLSVAATTERRKTLARGLPPAPQVCASVDQ